mgnify:CR=1 FL=1
MNKDNLISKNVKKRILSINNSLENFFNKIKFLILKIRKSRFDPNNKTFLAFGIIFILIFILFSIPSFYDKKIIESKIQSQILDKFNIETKFNEKVSFSLLPKPHFVTKNFSILRDGKEIAKVNKFKTYISYDEYFAFNNIKIRNLIFEKAEFNLNNNNINFFKNFLFTNPSKDIVEIKNSKLFYKNLSGDILFILKIFDSRFFYDYAKLENNLISNTELFNLPFYIEIKNDFFKKKLFTRINSKKIRLSVDNETYYRNKIKNGKTNINLINKNTKFEYKFDDEFFSYESEDKDFYKGQIDFKPFYLKKNINFKNFNLNNFLANKNLLMELLKSEILNNENLNLDVDLNIKNILNAEQFNNLYLNIDIVEGYISLADSTLMWNDDLKIILKETYLDISDENINFIGKFIFEFENIEKFYSVYQVKKSNRKDIKKIEIDFLYDFEKNNLNFDNPKVDNEFNLDLEKLTESYNKKKNRYFNKITFKNFINEFFNAYSG